MSVATVLTVYGIETKLKVAICSSLLLQQYLPFTVLKHTLGYIYPRLDTHGCNSTYRLRYWNEKTLIRDFIMIELQQYLPFTVLKPHSWRASNYCWFHVATVLTVYGIETTLTIVFHFIVNSCNSTYRLRYWNLACSISLSKKHKVATVLTVYGIETNQQIGSSGSNPVVCCNSTYRLRYWNLRPPLISSTEPW